MISRAFIGGMVKVEHQKRSGLLQEIEIPMWKWEVINMNFITGLPRSHRKFNSIWVIVNRLTKSARFLLVRTTYFAEDYAKFYHKEIVYLHGIPVSIISDRGAQFTTKFKKSFQESLGTRVNLSTAFHPQSDRKCISPAGWFEVRETSLFGPYLFHQAIEKVKLIEMYDDENWSFKIIRRIGQVAYELELPSELQAVHLVFHVSMLRNCIVDPSKIIPVDDIQVIKNLTYEEEPIAILDRRVCRLRTKDVASVKVLWRSKDREEMTWEAEAEMKSKYSPLFPAIDDAIPEETLQEFAPSINNLQGKSHTSTP
ncbi:uncharacterized protein LOC132639395 [Lycium barbarum]|uniref:uncharacterized protein LOC132639395 n=1 Tax=Lycium barbarum TaxID=112863 RepID=UPI00293E7EFB|nr:uncharacterized protein LOC132639395 [Lycium barbarum]